MSNITTFGGANLPSVQSLSGALRSIQSEVAPGGTVILKMDKTGHWVFGADQTEVEDGSLWAANPFSIRSFSHEGAHSLGGAAGSRDRGPAP